MSETKVVKLVTGETLITEATNNGDSYMITDPHIIIPAKDNSIALVPWIPYSPSQQDGVEICATKILMVMDPVGPLAEEYHNASRGEDDLAAVGAETDTGSPKGTDQ